jgi:hypothetical protein
MRDVTWITNFNLVAVSSYNEIVLVYQTGSRLLAMLSLRHSRSKTLGVCFAVQIALLWTSLAFPIDQLNKRPSFLLQLSSHLVSTITSSQTPTTASGSASVSQLAEQIDACIRAKKDPEDLLQKLESLNIAKEPNRSPAFLGTWHVW